MEKAKNMRPQDIVILLKILTYKHNDWKNIDIAEALKISASEVSESLNRSQFAGLIDFNKRIVSKLSLREFLIFGLKYAFPTKPGAMVKGIVTAHSAPPMEKQIISSKEKIVWKHPKRERPRLTN